MNNKLFYSGCKVAAESTSDYLSTHGVKLGEVYTVRAYYDDLNNSRLAVQVKGHSPIYLFDSEGNLRTVGKRFCRVVRVLPIP